MMACLDCHDYMNGYNNGKKEGTIEELETIQSEIVAKSCGRCGVDTWDNCKTQSLDGWCDVFDSLKIIDKRIAKLKGEIR